MYNDLSKLKLNLMLVRKGSIRVAFFLFLVYLVVTFMPWQGWLSEELSNVSLFGSALLLFLCVTMAFLEDEVQKILNKSPFSFGAGSGFDGMMQPMGGFDSFMQPYQEGMSEKDDLFAPMDENSSFDTDEDFENRVPKKLTKFSDFKKEYLGEVSSKYPERTKGDLVDRKTALRDVTEEVHDKLRNELLAHVFGNPEVEELPEGENALTYNPEAYYSGSYISAILINHPVGMWNHHQRRLRDLFKDEYEITFDEEGGISYRLK